MTKKYNFARLRVIIDSRTTKRTFFFIYKKICDKNVLQRQKKLFGLMENQ